MTLMSTSYNVDIQQELRQQCGLQWAGTKAIISTSDQTKFMNAEFSILNKIQLLKTIIFFSLILKIIFRFIYHEKYLYP